MDPLKPRFLGETGVQVTPLGLGAAQLGELYVKVSENQAQQTLEPAYDSGVSYFDSAPWYGRGLSEHRVGHFLRSQPRPSFVLSTKVGRVFSRPRDPGQFDSGGWAGGLHFEHRFDYSYEGVMRSYEDSLQRLGMNRVDCCWFTIWMSLSMAARKWSIPTSGSSSPAAGKPWRNCALAAKSRGLVPDSM